MGSVVVSLCEFDRRDFYEQTVPSCTSLSGSNYLFGHQFRKLISVRVQPRSRDRIQAFVGQDAYRVSFAGAAHHACDMFIAGIFVPEVRTAPGLN